jgi:PII-like signaling protein
MKKTVEEAKLLRVFVGENHRYHGLPLFEAIIQKAREKGLAGATVLKGVEGYGMHRKIHTHRLLELAEEMPIVIEIVDTPEKIESFLPLLDEMVKEGAVTLEDVRLIRYVPD